MTTFIVGCFMAVSGFTQGQPQQTVPPMQPPSAPMDPAVAPLAEAIPSLDDQTRRGLALQVALDRAGFSPGEIDGAPGPNTDRAVAAFKAARGTDDLGEVYTEPVTLYTITAEDVAGPFIGAVPEDMMQKAGLPTLAYTSVLELLAERFHASPKLLQRLNPDARFEGGETIAVPNVAPFIAPRLAQGQLTAGQTADGDTAAATRPVVPATAPGTSAPATSQEPKAASGVGPVTVIVTDRTSALEVQNAKGEVIFHAPVSVGTENDPLPVGEWKINGVAKNPPFHYNPKLFWDANPAHAKAKIPAGPNNPVGVVWIDLSKEHYGIHGTPEPSRIGYTQSHGCIRLTNWDAMRVAELVTPGTKVILR